MARAERSIIGFGSKEICLEVTPRDDEVHREPATVENSAVSQMKQRESKAKQVGSSSQT